MHSARQGQEEKKKTRFLQISATRLCTIMLLSSPFALAANSSNRHHAEKLILHDHWTLQSSAKVSAAGSTLSTSAFIPNGWHSATVPTTVVAALVKDKTLPDPFFARNLREFEGVTYPIGANFSNLAMDPASPYAISWWYRDQFVAPASYAGTPSG